MDKLIVEGGTPLRGRIKVSGAKNACLPILAAVLLSDDESIIRNVPDLKDVNTMLDILTGLGRKAVREKDVVRISGGIVDRPVAPYELVSTMRASICVLGPLLGRYHEAKVSFPGGCVIGPRPIDLHIKGLKALGTVIKVEEGYIIASAPKLTGTRIYLGGHFGSSVLATANTLMAAVLAEGDTVIEDAAGEPEVADLANMLAKMGARIEGIGTATIRVRGVKKLKGVDYTIISDRIEAGTFLIAAVLTDGKLFIEGASAEHNLALIDKLEECGGSVEEKQGGLEACRATRSIRPTHITTLPYPGFPTDLQAQMMSLSAMSDGISVITEKIYPERFIHVSELNRMGAEIMLEGASAIIKGVKRLSGAPVMASDLRASAALVLAGLVADGRTEISRIYHLDRGYEHIEEKLSAVGARVRREKEKKKSSQGKAPGKGV
ncbi:MAG: UDP-N-acetylglucosamine 1-carboxyvinyltransferase [Candidatus Omnitrophica bacterium]|nr:UDP-N-acetylglucosamine 1-carboxyvinyltransferase [Candidatus Omnitrophota bacterium]MDD4012988.1 UDP-N-acetylglucosamine 1-carboxyvinyltransferase [Candidatus Omnitrophota bacterium]